jgi:hypothetical protein
MQLDIKRGVIIIKGIRQTKYETYQEQYAGPYILHRGLHHAGVSEQVENLCEN